MGGQSPDGDSFARRSHSRREGGQSPDGDSFARRAILDAEARWILTLQKYCVLRNYTIIIVDYDINFISLHHCFHHFQRFSYFPLHFISVEAGAEFGGCLAEGFAVAFGEVGGCGESYFVCYLGYGFGGGGEHLACAFEAHVADEFYG